MTQVQRTKSGVFIDVHRQAGPTGSILYTPTTPTLEKTLLGI